MLAETDEAFIQNVPHRHRRAAQGGRGRRVVRRGDDADLLALREFKQPLFHLQAAGDDDHADAFLDGGFLDVLPVADDDAQFFPQKRFHPRGERFGTHRANDHDQILLALRLERDEQFALQRLRKIGERGQHAPRVHQPVGRGEKKFAQLEQREQAVAAPLLVEHGQDADVALVHEMQGLGGGGVRRHAHDLALHHVGNFQRHVSHESGRGHAKGVQDKINPVVGVAAARGHGLSHAGAAFELRVADGRADRVRVGVAVADDKYFAHTNKSARRLVGLMIFSKHGPWRGPTTTRWF